MLFRSRTTRQREHNVHYKRFVYTTTTKILVLHAPPPPLSLISLLLPITSRKLLSKSHHSLFSHHFTDFEELLHLLSERPTISSSDINKGQGTGGMIRCSKARAMFAMRACRKSVMIGTALNKSQMTSVRSPFFPSSLVFNIYLFYTI